MTTHQGHSLATTSCEETINEPLNFHQAPGSMLYPPFDNHLAEDLLFALWLACRHPVYGPFFQGNMYVHASHVTHFFLVWQPLLGPYNCSLVAEYCSVCCSLWGTAAMPAYRCQHFTKLSSSVSSLTCCKSSKSCWSDGSVTSLSPGHGQAANTCRAEAHIILR